MYESDEQNNKDGFETDEIPHHQELKPQHLNTRNSIHAEDARYSLPPGKAVVSKTYSLHPDIATGWSPKKGRSHPVPITVDAPYFDQIFDKILRNQSHGMKLCYLGPRYDNTYYSWYQMPFDFPYPHIKPPENMKFTNRQFCGQHPSMRNDVVFDSFYQSANLDCAIKVGEFEYDLYLRVDSNTRGHYLWFNFKVANLQKNVAYTFNICNMQKDCSLYERGMKPYMLSAMAKQKIGREWAQQGDNVKYQKKPSKSLSLIDAKCRMFFKLSYEFSTPYDKDVVQMSYCIPYTYTDLKRYLENRRRLNKDKKFYIESRLCMSLGGLSIPMLTIHEDGDEENIRNISNASTARKKCIMIACRVHPGESNASFMMQGLIDFLCSNKKYARHLRSKIVFKIVPMLNPDGVSFGNYRTGLSGRDFNREYINPDPHIFPEVYCLKKLVTEKKKKYGNNLIMFLDFHGHSMKKNVFMYGPQHSLMEKYYYQSRVFPRILSKRTIMFRYYSCVFKIQEEKKTTARAIFIRMHNIPLSYTIQASNGSYYDTENLKDVPFTEKLWIEMGEEIGCGLSQYLSLVEAAELARLQKFERMHLNHQYAEKDDNNLRIIKLSERKRKKKQNEKDLVHLGRIQKEQIDDDEDLFKYIYQEIEEAQAYRRQQAGQVHPQPQSEEDEIMGGKSDQESAGNDLDQKQLQQLYQIIKSKTKSSNVKLSNRNQSNLSPTKSQQKLNKSDNSCKMTNRRVLSAMGSHLKKKQTQSKQAVKIVLNINLKDERQPPSKFHIRPLTACEEKKKQPKTFEEFVLDYKSWEKSQKSERHLKLSQRKRSDNILEAKNVSSDSTRAADWGNKKIDLSMYHSIQHSKRSSPSKK